MNSQEKLASSTTSNDVLSAMPSSVAGASNGTSNVAAGGTSGASDLSAGGSVGTPSGSGGLGGMPSGSGGLVGSSFGVAGGSGTGGVASDNTAGTASDDTLNTSGAAAGGMAGVARTGGADAPATSADCPEGALLCDDFESYPEQTAPTGPWQVSNVGNATTVVDSLQAFSGSKAAHFLGPVDGNREYSFMTASDAPTFPVAGDQLFVRFMLYTARWPDGSHTRLAWVGTKQALSTPTRGFDGAGYVLANYNGIAMERLASGYYRDNRT